MKGLKPRPATQQRARKPAATTVYDELRKRILHGDLPPGTLVNEIETAADLEVSRTPVREALRELLNDGLLREGPRRQSLVAEASDELAREVRLMRLAVETLSVREAAAVHDTSGVDMLRLTMIRTDRAIAADNLNETLDCNDEFHLLIAQMAGLHLVADSVHRLSGLSRLMGYSRGWTTPGLRKIALEHQALIDAIDNGDEALSERLMRTHLDGLGSTGRQSRTARA